MAKDCNSIPHAQNAEENLDLLAAFSHVYVVEKRISGIQLGLAILAAVLGPLLAWINPDLRVWAAITSVVVLVLDAAVLDGWRETNRRLGTSIQEFFDTKLYLLPWNHLKCGAKPDHETLVEHSRAFRRAHPQLVNLRDWYPTRVNEVPLSYARLICQRCNLRWDMGLRRKYVNILLVLLTVLGLSGLVYAVAQKLTTEQLVLSVLIPILPLVSRIVKGCKEQNKIADELDKQKAYLEEIWNRYSTSATVDDQVMADESRRIQDVIFDRRSRAPRVPEFLHRIYREEFQTQMDEAAGKYIDSIKWILKSRT